ncbi:MAG: hydroxymethylbilane synthase [Fibrobacteraceae bacterium]|nr:hydroxymethylbilane synthase [Fibrobacteraceae bacterium]
MKKLKLGTRGSGLALAQADLAKKCIEDKFPEYSVEICVIKTSGDKDRVRSLVAFGGEGVFVKELEQALLEKEIDFAVHSLKDVPDKMDPRLSLVGFLKREDPRDVLVSNGKLLKELPIGAVVGTGSPRRVLQLKSLRSDLHFLNLRGNLPSRLEKVKNGELSAIVLGAAGLNRLGLESSISEKFDTNQMTPAIGQGIVAIQTLKENAEICRIISEISDKVAAAAATLERRWMNLLGGGCRVPMGAILEEQSNGSYLFTAYLADPRDGRSLRRSLYFQNFGGDPLEFENFAKAYIAECRKKKIMLPFEAPGAEALAAFWNAEH